MFDSVVIGQILASAVLSVWLWLTGSCWFGCAATSGKEFIYLPCLWAKARLQTGIYLKSHRVGIWPNAILSWGPCMNQDSCAVGKKKFWPRQHSSFGVLRHQSINLVLQAGKDLMGQALKPRYHCMQTQLPGINGWWLAQSPIADWHLWPVTGFILQRRVAYQMV